MSRAVEIEVKASQLPELLKVLAKYDKDVSELNDKYGARSLAVDISSYSSKLLRELLPIFPGDSANKQTRAYISAYISILENPKAPVKKLELLPEALWRYLVKDCIDGWLYEEILDGVHVAYVVTDILYCISGSYREEPYVSVALRANKPEFTGEEHKDYDDGLLKKSIVFHRSQLASPGIMLLRRGLLKETAELKAEYTRQYQIFEVLRSMESKQFLCHGVMLGIELDSWWAREKRYTLPHPSKMVNDEEILGRKITLSTSNYHLAGYGIKEDSKKFARIPVHPFILFFDLTRHVSCWVHVDNCKLYEYDITLKDKLVLPDRHRDLIDVLTTDMDIFVEDIVAGKSGGTALLCYGNPGLGKTLTAEVYSEVVKRPLYRVHAGQLGTDVSSVETALEQILRRSERWGAILLLDEADVYIRRRGDDMQHNAVVAAFLRTLEYFHGLLFLTTNRVNDVDDAIASRMVAMFKYETPDALQAAALWRILATQFGLKISAKAVAELVAEFPVASGRDIKQLLKLTMKYCKYKELPLSVAAFRICAMFRGIK